MTVLIFDGKTLLADKRGVNGVCIEESIKMVHVVTEGVEDVKSIYEGLLLRQLVGKIQNEDYPNKAEFIFAMTGYSSTCIKILEFLQNPSKGKLKIERDKVMSCGLLLELQDGMLYTVHNDYSADIVLENKFAMGSGKQVALGALHAGANAKKTLEICTRLVSSVGNGSTVFNLPEKLIQRRTQILNSLTEDDIFTHTRK